MSKIIVLDELTINKIAAGEVVDRPSSIVKELIENSIDAGANEINVEIKNGGIKYIKITDNGIGFEKDDIEIAFERHATSKIKQETDILKITSMGFRGEALASIGAISKVTLVSKNINEEVGNKIIVEGGKVLSFEPAASKTGTSITVENVFYNVPARYKFLKKDATEAGYIALAITRLALANPNIAFKYITNNKQEIYTNGNGNILDTAYSLFGKAVKNNLLEVDYIYENIKVNGIIGTPKISRGTRQHEFTFVNNRYITDKMMIKAIENAFHQKLSIGKFPFGIININIPSSEVDVNVHPAKLEVKFEDEKKVYHSIYYAIKETLLKYEKENSPFKQAEQVYNLNCSLEETPSFKYINQKPEEKILVSSEKEMIEAPSNLLKLDSNSLEKSSELLEYKEKTEEVEKQVEYLNEQSSSQEFTKQVDAILESDLKYKHIGNVFDTYIIIQIDQKMHIIDQHAAHERLLYEKIKNNYYSKNRQTQMLLIPEIIEITSSEMTIVRENKEMFELSGFVLEEFGDKEIKINGIPNIGYDIDFKEMFMDGIDELMGASKTTKEEKETRFIYTLACKAAVKGNMKLSKEEQIDLIDNMIKLENPFTCPHGRPTAYEISKYEIERKFLRK